MCIFSKVAKYRRVTKLCHLLLFFFNLLSVAVARLLNYYFMIYVCNVSISWKINTLISSSPLTSGTVVMLMTSQFHALKTLLSALELNLGPSMVTTVPPSWALRPRSAHEASTTLRVSSQNDGCMGTWATVPKFGPLDWSWNVWWRFVVLGWRRRKRRKKDNRDAI